MLRAVLKNGMLKTEKIPYGDNEFMFVENISIQS